MHFSCSCKEKEDEPTTVGFELIHWTSETKLFQKCLNSLLLLFYIILSILLYSVKLNKVCWVSQGIGLLGGMMLDEIERQEQIF